MKNETVIGIIGNTQGVSRARKPIEIDSNTKDQKPAAIASSRLISLELLTVRAATNSLNSFRAGPSSISRVVLIFTSAGG